jgi:glutamyl-tRNA synthetase
VDEAPPLLQYGPVPTGRFARTTGRFARTTGRFARTTGRFARTTGRFAPSPTGALHVGNLRTALVAWLAARSDGGRFLVRMEDLDRVTSSRVHAAGQLHDLAALGLDSDGEVVFQSERFDRYEAALATLGAAGLTYPCYCTRREIQEAASAPHQPVPDGAYPGTCRDLTRAQQAARAAGSRPPALRLRANGETVTFTDLVLGPVTGVVDDVVLRRNDGVPAYNLAVVIDDGAQGVTQVVRGDDLASSTPRQLHLARLLDLPAPQHAHVPLVLGGDGARLAKRHGAVTLADLRAAGHVPTTVLAHLATSLGLAEPGEPVRAPDLVERFSWDRLPRRPWHLHGDPYARDDG